MIEGILRTLNSLGLSRHVAEAGVSHVLQSEDMSKMKNNAIVGNIGHFDNEIDMAGLIGWQGIKRQNIKPQVRCRTLIAQLRGFAPMGAMGACRGGLSSGPVTLDSHGNCQPWHPVSVERALLPPPAVL